MRARLSLALEVGHQIYMLLPSFKFILFVGFIKLNFVWLLIWLVLVNEFLNNVNIILTLSFLSSLR